MKRSVVLLAVLLAAAGPAAGPARAADASGDAVAAPGAPDLGGSVRVARGGRAHLRGTGAGPRVRVRLERRVAGGWDGVTTVTADAEGRFGARVRTPVRGTRHRYRAVVRGRPPAEPWTVRARDLTLAAFGDVNLGEPVASVMRRRGLRFPWSGVAPLLRRADLAFGNLECAVSTRGRPEDKRFTFRGSPAALRAARRTAGIDVLNLANNHVGDYGRTAMLDTFRHVRRFGMTGVGAGPDLADARRPRVVERLGLRVAFVGFSDILPLSFAAGPRRPGTRFASHAAIAADVRAARRRADVVVATFHWGRERVTRENARQRGFAATALRAGADAVIGAHPHVLQPVRRTGRRLVAYSLGNFVWSAGSGLTARTGVLVLRLSRRGVEGHWLRRAVIRGTRPVFVGRGPRSAGPWRLARTMSG